MCSHASAGAIDWRNATDNEPQRWLPAGPTVDGQLGRCSCAPCRRFPLERLTSQVGVLYDVVGRWMKVPAAKHDWSFASGRGDQSGLSNDKHPARKAFTGGLSNYPPCPIGAPAAGPLSALVARAAGSQCSSSRSFSREHQAVRHSRSLCRLARSGDGLTRLSLPLHSLSSDRFTSPSGAVWPVFLDSPHFLPFSLSTPLLLLPLLSTPSRSLQLPPTRRKIRSSTTSLRNSWAPEASPPTVAILPRALSAYTPR